MGWIKAVIGARWFPYVLIGMGVLVTAVYGWGYLKGYNKAETVYLAEMNEALTRQMKTLLARKERELQIALETERERNAVTRRVQEVARPAGNSCELAPECVRWFDDVLRSARPD